MPEGALNEVTVVEYSRGAMGATCAKAMADLGAAVVKVEPPDGDPLRLAGPFPDDEPHPDKSGLFLYLNANKRGVTLDLESGSDRSKLRRLIAAADIFVTDLQPRDASRLSLDYDSLKQVNEGLVATYVTHFGHTGPYKDYQGTDLISWHMGGLGYETPAFYVTDPEKEYPLRGGTHQAEYLAGWTAAAATMAALAHRDTYGGGQMVDVSAMEAVANHIRTSFAIYSYDISRVPENRLKVHFPWIWPCKDGHVSIAFTLDHWWRSFKEVMGCPEWAESPDFDDFAGRRDNVELIEGNVRRWLLDYTRAELYEILQAAGVSCFPVQSMGEVIAHPQFRARDFFVEQDHPVAGKILQPGPPVRFSRTPWELREPAPAQGQHNESIFSPLDGPQRESAARRRSEGSDIIRNRPLNGLRVLDFGWILSVPHCGTWLGSLGAEVIRVESNTRLELNRQGVGGFADGIGGSPNRSAAWNGINFSKLDLTLDLSTEKAKEIIRELVSISDIIIENFATGVMGRLGLDYESVRRIKPDIIMLSGSTLGVTGPERNASGWGPNVCSFAGLPSISGYPGGPPVNMGGNWPDYLVGTMMVFSLLSALRHRDRTGVGQYIEASMAEVVAGAIPEAYLDYSMNGRLKERDGNHDPNMAPHGVYPCSGVDQWVAIAVRDDADWRAMRRAMGNPHWASNKSYDSFPGRKGDETEIDRMLSEWTAKMGPREVMETLQAEGVPCGPVMGIMELMNDPHLKERGFVIELDHDEVGVRNVAGLPAHFSAMPEIAYSPSPLLGQHNEMIVGEILGMPLDQVRELVEGKVIY
ncbi:MAG: CoA transferase [Chloroflexi bacterium]|nr:CoA transferase [Chloroflexota bacterium]